MSKIFKVKDLLQNNDFAQLRNKISQWQDESFHYSFGLAKKKQTLFDQPILLVLKFRKNDHQAFVSLFQQLKSSKSPFLQGKPKYKAQLDVRILKEIQQQQQKLIFVFKGKQEKQWKLSFLDQFVATLWNSYIEEKLLGLNRYQRSSNKNKIEQKKRKIQAKSEQINENPEIQQKGIDQRKFLASIRQLKEQNNKQTIENQLNINLRAQNVGLMQITEKQLQEEKIIIWKEKHQKSHGELIQEIQIQKLKIKEHQQYEIQLNKTIKELKDQKYQYELLIQNLKKKDQDQRIQLFEVKREINQMEQSLKQNIKKYQSLVIQINEKTQELASQQKKYQDINLQLIKNRKESLDQIQKLKQLNYRTKMVQDRNSQLICQKKGMEDSICKTQIQKVNNQMYHIFEGDILTGNSSHKRFLRDEIQKLKTRKILRTKVIYAFDKLNKTNFHHYVDHHEDIMLILRTTRGLLIAGYSQLPFKTNQTQIGRGLLLSLTEQRSYKLIRGKKPVIYDEYYLIFGNSELRIKSNEDKVFSNFGLGTGFFDSQNCQINNLLGEGTNREVKMDTFQVHKIIYQGFELQGN